MIDNTLREILNILSKTCRKATSFLSSEIQKSKKQRTDKTILKKIIPLSKCIYSDNNPNRAPEYLAEQFSDEKMRLWLYDNPNHSIFKSKQTTALHTLVRLMDAEGIKKIGSAIADVNQIEKASGIAAIDLVTGMGHDLSSQNFLMSQKKRYLHRKRNQVFIALCQIGCTISIDTLLQIATKTKARSLLFNAAYYFYKGCDIEQEKNPFSKGDKRKISFKYIEKFNKENLSLSFNEQNTVRNSPLIKGYTKGQIDEILKTLIMKLTQVMHRTLSESLSQKKEKERVAVST